MPSEPRLFVFDIDGTLVSSRHEVLPGTRAALRELEARGHTVLLASARPPRGIDAVAAGVIRDGAMAIALNGAFIYAGGVALHETPLAPAAVTAAIEAARAHGVHVSLLSGSRWLVERENELTRLEARIVRFEPEVVPDLLALGGLKVHKVMLMGAPGSAAAVQAWLAAHERRVTASLSKPEYVEVVARGVSKAHALEFVAANRGVPLERVTVFGDGENDLEMMRLAGTSVAMANAGERVRGAATLVTASNDEDGIVRALERLGAI